MVDKSPGPSSCPQVGRLAEFAAGTLQAALSGAVGEHVSGCESCRQHLAELRDEEQIATRLRGALGLEQEALLRSQLQEQLASQYELLDVLGRGSSGVVFKARDIKLDRLVAIKALAADQADRIRKVIEEARNLARANHPNIAAIHAVCDQGDAPHIVMEFVDGLPVTDVLADRPISQQLDAFCQALRAVAELHHRGIVHRDLKPANILVDRKGRIKLVDLGIARQRDASASARAEGTPAYLAPEQSLGGPTQPAADVFSLGVVLFELLTGQRPFPGQSVSQTIAAIRQADPPLPRSLRVDIPGPLQAICLAAMEKEPSLRYPSAREFLRDIERFLQGEAVSATPTLLMSVLEHGIDRHLGDLDRWQKDRMISQREHDYFLDKYDCLRQREEFWVLDSRRISFSQVMLHLGAWACVVSAFLMLAFPWSHSGLIRPLLPSVLLGVLLVAGLLLWQRHSNRVAIVLLMGAAITCPIAMATVLDHFKWMGAAGGDDLLKGLITDPQLLATTICAFILNTVLWRRTRTSAFALIWGLGAVALATACFSLTGLRTQLSQGRFDTAAGWYLWPGMLLVALAMVWDLRWKKETFAAPLYVIGVAMLLICLSLIAGFGPTLQWLGLTHHEHGPDLIRQVKYSFMINGLLYLLVGLLADRAGSSHWLRRIGTLLFWLAPSHVLIPILLLENQWAILPSSWTLAELLLPVGAMVFVFASVPKQMKSFFFSGLFYLGISVQRLTARHFEDRLAWPIALAVIGMCLAFVAWRYPGLFDRKRHGNRVK